MGGGKKKGGIPDGWLGCPPMSTGFIDDRFIVFKTPLKPELRRKLPHADQFSIENVLENVGRMNNSRIGLWIDLTNTSRYYNCNEIRNLGILYEKFACEGHGKAPNERAIYNFCGIVHRFFKNNHRDYIAVHCTHGFNRTGFLICCYLIRFRRFTAAEAVLEFARHRQPGIYRQTYVDALYNMTRPIQSPLKVVEPVWLRQEANASSIVLGNRTSTVDQDHEVPSSTSNSANVLEVLPINTQISHQSSSTPSIPMKQDS